MSRTSAQEFADFISICGSFHSDNLVWCHGNAGCISKGYPPSQKQRVSKRASIMKKRIVLCMITGVFMFAGCGGTKTGDADSVSVPEKEAVENEFRK